jgi:hypothetical protein
MYAQEISASRFAELCPGLVVSETSPYFTRTPYFLKTSLTTFFFTPLAVRMRLLAASLPRTETDQTLLGAVPVYRLAPSFPIYLSRGGIESLYVIYS